MERFCQIYIYDPKEQIIIIKKMMCCMGARNTAGFTNTLRQGNLPPHTHLTYEGVFNEIKFNVGPKAVKTLDMHLGYSRFQFMSSQFDNSINDYLALFLKGKADGEQRKEDSPRMNLVICLDISGSMGGSLGGDPLAYQPHSNRLKLSVEAIKMLISKLKPYDSMGVVVFNNSSRTIFESTYKKFITPAIFEKLDQVSAGGGTTIINGFNTSRDLLLNWQKNHPDAKAENRIIMLTDVCDQNFDHYKNFVENSAEEHHINTSIIGISTDFRSESCETLKDIKGFNYFSAVNQEDIKKYVLETFDFGFFPSANNIQILIDSPDIADIEVFGTPDSDKVEEYRKESTQGSHWTVTKMKSCFPSEIQVQDGNVYTIGGLILVKLKKTNKGSSFKGQIHLTYDDPEGEHFSQTYPVNFEFHPEEQFFSGEELREAIEGFVFTSELKTILKESAKTSDHQEIYKKYWQMLTNLESLCPKSKAKDYENIKKIMEKYKPKQIEVETSH